VRRGRLVVVDHEARSFGPVTYPSSEADMSQIVLAAARDRDNARIAAGLRVRTGS